MSDVGVVPAHVRHHWIAADEIPADANATVNRGQMYVLELRPEVTSGPPVVLIHGGGGQGLDFLARADGGPGWAHGLVAAGHPVFVVDRPGFGRSALTTPLRRSPEPVTLADAQSLARGGCTPPVRGCWAESLDSPALHAFAAGLGPALGDEDRASRHEVRIADSLIRLTGPCIVLMHSAGAAMGWALGVRHAAAVRGIVAVEPVWPRAVPMAAASASDWPGGDWAALASVPVLVVCSQASAYRAHALDVAEALRRLLPHVKVLDLARDGLPEVGHLMMLDDGAPRVLERLLEWISDNDGRYGDARGASRS